MKKGFMVASALLMAAGLVIFWGAFLVSGCEFAKLDITEYETNVYAIEDDFGSIVIGTENSDVVFVPSEDGSVRVECLESKKIRHTVSVENGTLKITGKDERNWVDHISFFSKPLSVTVYLPVREYDMLKIDGSTGDISVPERFTFGSAEFQLSTGDVDFAASVDGLLTIRTGTGDIKLTNVTAGAVDLSVSTGDVTVSYLECASDFSVKVSTGDTDIRLMGCTSFTSTGSTGDIRMANAFASNALQITRSTGDVRFDNCDAGEITVKTSTGDVTGTLRSGKLFLASTSTGSVHVPADEFGAGACYLTTTTGDIDIRLK